MNLVLATVCYKTLMFSLYDVDSLKSNFELLVSRHSFTERSNTFWKYDGINLHHAACLASYLKDLPPLHIIDKNGLHLFSLYEDGRGKNLSPLWLRQHSKLNLPWWMLPIPAGIQTGTVWPGLGRHTENAKKEITETSLGCGGLSLVVMPSSLRPYWHHRPRKFWTGRFLVYASKTVVLTHTQWLIVKRKCNNCNFWWFLAWSWFTLSCSSFQTQIFGADCSVHFAGVFLKEFFVPLWQER